MSNEEKERMIGRVVTEYRQAQEKLTAIKTKAEQYAQLFAATSSQLRSRDPKAPAELAAGYPSREDLIALFDELRETHQQMAVATRHLRDLGLTGIE
jgi:hypothetical protein